MKVRLVVLLVSLAYLLVSGRAAIGEMQQSSREGGFGRDHLDSVASHRPLPQVTAIRPKLSGATVYVGDQGLDPSQVVIQTGQVVTWINQTSTILRLVSGQPYQAYLPLVLRDVEGGDSVSAAASIAMMPVGPTEWGGDIAPGGTYTHTFTQVGDHYYFIASHPAWIGEVIVQPGPGRNLDEIVRAIRILTSVGDFTLDCGASYEYYNYIYYTSEAWLDHQLGGTWRSYDHFYPPGLRLSSYYVLVNDVESAGSPHSFAHDLSGIGYNQFHHVVSYTGAFTSTLYDSFTYSITILSSPYLETATVHKDYGSGETYRIDLDITRDLAKPRILSYVATVYGPSYQGVTATVTGVTSPSFPLLCIRY